VDATPLRLELPAEVAGAAGVANVSALLVRPAGARAVLVLAHGAGAGMEHAFLADAARGLAARGVATLRFQFPFVERGSRRTDPPAVAVATVAAAVEAAAIACPGLPLAAGGKSFGGRMASHAAAEGRIPAARGLVFFGFPLHPAGKPGVARAAHLPRVPVPMLFLQGTRDSLAELALVRATVAALGERATLHVVDDADHAFHVRASSGRNDAAALAEMLDGAAAWIEARVPAP
jgi:predicted alpha/beta-hydrolase family hydrolase